MEKIFYMMFFAAGIFASCTDDDYTQMSSPNDGNIITFATNSGNTQTRAGQTATSVSQFDVSAVTSDGAPFFTSLKFKYNSNGGFFESTPTYYWPASKSLSFYAVNVPGTISLNTSNVPSYLYTNWNGENDLVAAVVKSGVKQNPYPLQFQHICSQIHVSFEANDKANALTYKVVGLKMTAPSSGTYSFGNVTGGSGAWRITDTNTSEYSYSSALPFTFAHNVSKARLDGCYWNILPVADGNIVFKVEYVVLQNGQVVSDFTGLNAKQCTITQPKLVMGKKYCYNFSLTYTSDNEIKFSTSIMNWADEYTTNQYPETPTK